MSDQDKSRSTGLPDPALPAADRDAATLAKNAQAIGGEDVMTAADEMFRNQMRDSNDPQAKNWVELDNQAREVGHALDKDQSQLERRQGSGGTIHEVESRLNDARNDRDEFLAQGKPPLHAREARADYEARLGSFDTDIAASKKSMFSLAKDTSPDELGKLQERIEQRQQQMDDVVSQRQDIAKLPSEHAGQEQTLSMQERIEQSRQSWAPEQDQGPSQRGNRQGQVQSQSGQSQDGNEAGQRLKPNYAAMRETTDDLAFARQLEADQRAAQQHYGHLPNDKEMQEFIGNREQQDGQGQQQGQGNFQQNLQQRRGQQM